MNIAYRWFLGCSLYENILHFSTVPHNFKHRYSIEVIDQVFEWTLQAIEEADDLSPKRYSSTARI